MSRNALRIAEGLRNIAYRKHELMSGTVVPGSVDTSSCTCSVLLTDMDEPLEGVMLNTTLAGTNGIVQYPADNSDVVVAGLDGSGSYFLICAGTLTQTIVTIGDCVLKMDDSGFAISKASESLGKCLDDLINAINEITVPTGVGPSGTPVNAANISAIQSRLKSFLK